VYLLDTMVVFERTKSRPDRGVLSWVAARSPDHFFVSVLTLGEVSFGIRRLPPSARRTLLDHWYSDELKPFFEARVLDVNEAIVDVWAGLRALRRSTPPSIDSLIAATALAYDLTVVTRNERHFAECGAAVINPWSP
jgi:toxin FitB